jgi:phage/plasmid-like protein (TIGR03299 family)
MTTTETTGRSISDAERPLWVGQTPAAWDDVVRSVNPEEAHDAASMIAAAGLHWTVEQHALEAVVEREYQSLRISVPRHVANVRSDTRAVLGVVGEGYEPLQNASAFAFCDAITDSGRAHWIGAGATHGGARVHALMRLDREIRIGGAEGEDVLPLLCFRNGHDGGLAVTVSVVPFRLACLNGMLLPIAGAERTWKARHTANVEAKLADARRTLGIAWRYYDELEAGGCSASGSAKESSNASSPDSCRCRRRAPTRPMADVRYATPSGYARRFAPPIGRRPTWTRFGAPDGACCRP